MRPSTGGVGAKTRMGAILPITTSLLHSLCTSYALLNSENVIPPSTNTITLPPFLLSSSLSSFLVPPPPPSPPPPPIPHPSSLSVCGVFFAHVGLVDRNVFTALPSPGTVPALLAICWTTDAVASP